MRETIREPIRRAAEAIAAADAVAIACHVSPDGDAIGSSLALAHAARAAGKAAVASFGDPFAVPANFEFLGTGPLVPSAEFPSEPAVMVVFDVASPDRLGELAGPAGRAGTLIVVDHHASNAGFGDIVVIDPGASSAAQLAFYLIRELGWPLDPAVATALLTGIVSDTGRFQYSSTDGETLRVAADLLEAGAQPDEIGQQLFESAPFGYLHATAAVLSRALLEPDLHFVWSVLYAADLEAAGIGPEDTDALIDDLRIAREADVTLLAKEDERGWKLSLRSRGRVDVGSIALDLGGGGHHNAAGCTVPGSLEAAVDAIRSRLRG
jgi:phosphoesterase RecJ-like protein